MSVAELSVVFAGGDRVQVSFNGTDSGWLEFANPLPTNSADAETADARKDIRWLVETYGVASLGRNDDEEARRIEARLPLVGKALFRSLFGRSEAYEPFLDFRKAAAEQRVITIHSDQASILSLPWELLHDPKGKFLFRENPHISVRRKITGAEKGRQPFSFTPKASLHLLFVVSRPADEGFLDPRSDPEAVLDALEKHAAGRVTSEFLRPPTLGALVERLRDPSLPPVDILHFDGHGAFLRVLKGQDPKDADRDPSIPRSALHRERQTQDAKKGDEPVGTGFLVFENGDGKKDLVSAAELGDNLFQSRVSLVVLSACQTASLDEQGDPMASVAGTLTGTGIPAILAMTHSVLVHTTRALFGTFYGSLAKGQGIAAALDDARLYLDLHPEKYEVQREGKREKLTLRDWFVPALYQGGEDAALLIPARELPASTELLAKESSRPPRHNLRERHEAGFFGRRRELWNIERWFADKARRISITGFGGQGKTELAMEAGRWLLRIGMSRQAVFVDYAGFQSHDALAVAIRTLSVVLEETFTGPEEVAEALRRTPTLVILNNLETVSDTALAELLTAAAQWSEAGESRVLLTSRRPETGHTKYAVQGTFQHRRIRLEGLGSATHPDDALEWFRQLSLLPTAELPQVPPPKREDLIRLFDRVGFHPLSICVLVPQLRTRTAVELGRRLEHLLSEDAKSVLAVEGAPPSLAASLELSLERLSETERHAVVDWVCSVEGRLRTISWRLQR